MRDLCLAVLAHAHRDCLEDQLENLRAFAPYADVVVFNGGHVADLTRGLHVDTCPYSEPLTWGHLQLFQYGVLRWLYEERRPYRFVVSLDSDMLLIKSGLLQFLERSMAESEYMAHDFEEVQPDTRALNGRRYYFGWRERWQPLLGLQHPFHCFNPGQVFTWPYVERLMTFAHRRELVALMRTSRIPVLEEMIYPSLAVALGCRPRAHPAPRQDAVRDVRRHTASEMRTYLEQPDVFFVHPVAMHVDAPERMLVRRLADGHQVAFDDRAFDAYRLPQPRRLRRWLHPVTSPLKDLYLRWTARGGLPAPHDRSRAVDHSSGRA